MRLVRVRHDGEVRSGIIVDDEIRFIGAPVSDSGAEPTYVGEGIPLAGAQLLAPLEPRTIIGVGRNYVAHIEEMGYPRPERPSLFMKPVSAVIGPNDDVVLPPESARVEHEAEVVLVVGRGGRNIAVEEADAAILGITCANDVSARDLQASDDSVIRGKGFDTFCPLGPWITTGIPLRQPLTVSCRVNDELRQSAATDDLLFDLPTIVAYVSRFTTLRYGDIILTGSPGGSARLLPGDSVEIGIDAVGSFRHGVASERG